MERKEGIVVGAATALVLYTLALVVLGPIVYSALTNRTISNTGSVESLGVGVYWDQSCTNTTSSINWGILEPGTNKSVTVYIKNEGNSAVTLAKTTSSWSPSNAASYITLDWNYGGQTLSVNQVIPVKLTLSVSTSISGITNFSFDTIITASG